MMFIMTLLVVVVVEYYGFSEGVYQSPTSVGIFLPDRLDFLRL
jgi:hypothetical protein